MDEKKGFSEAEEEKERSNQGDNGPSVTDAPGDGANEAGAHGYQETKLGESQIHHYAEAVSVSPASPPG